MKTSFIPLVIFFFLSFNSWAAAENDEPQEDDGFEVTIILSATKTFSLPHAGLSEYKKKISKKLDQTAKSSATGNGKKMEQFKYDDRKGNTVSFKFESDTKTEVSTCKITLKGSQEFVDKQRKELMDPQKEVLKQ